MSEATAPPRKVNWLILVLGLLPLLGFAALMMVGFTKDPRALDQTIMLDKPAPSFALQTLDGQQVDLASLRGKPVVVNFWSTWCVPCKQEHPLLQAAPTLYPEVTFVGVIYQDTPSAVQSQLRRAPLPYQQLVDPNGRVAIAYGVTGVPETFFIRPDGTIQAKVARALNEQDLAEQLEEMLR